jgi:hypothetical protein
MGFDVAVVQEGAESFFSFMIHRLFGTVKRKRPDDIEGLIHFIIHPVFLPASIDICRREVCNLAIRNRMVPPSIVVCPVTSIGRSWLHSRKHFIEKVGHLLPGAAVCRRAVGQGRHPVIASIGVGEAVAGAAIGDQLPVDG